MTSKERAKYLIKLFKKEVPGHDGDFGNYQAIVCASIFADELVKLTPSVYVTKDEYIDSSHRQYWEEVKKEVISLK